MARGSALVVVVLIVLTLAGCAASTAPAQGQGQASPRVRCVSDPRETGTRPLIFFFCIQSP